MNTIASKIKTKKAIAVTLSSLAASISMCICCALPAFLLLLGGGPILASLFTTFPKLLLLEKYSIFLFLFSGSLIIISGMLRWKSRNYACPSDPVEEKTCIKLNCFNKYLYFFTVIVFLIGTFSTFILPKIYQNNPF